MQVIDVSPEKREIVEADPYAELAEMTPSYIANGIKSIPSDIKEKSEHLLLRHITDPQEEVSLRRLRTAFWIEHGRAARTNTNLNMSNIYTGICDASYFKKKVAGNNFKLTYMLRPPVDYAIAMEELVMYAIEQERDILAQPHINADGTIDSKAAAVKQKISETAQNRQKGMAVHRTQNINTNINKWDSKESAPGARNVNDMSPTEIKQRLLELEAERNKEDGNQG